MDKGAPVARELAPAGLRSNPKADDSICLTHRIAWFEGCCAAQREQAPSPQETYRPAFCYKSTHRNAIPSPRLDLPSELMRWLGSFSPAESKVRGVTSKHRQS